MKRKIAFILALTLMLSALLTSCSADEFIIAATPDAEEQAAVEGILSAYMTAYEENNAAGATELFSSEVGATTESIAQYFEQIHALSPAPYTPGEIYYMKNLPESEANVKVKKDKSDVNYIELLPATKDLVCAFYTSESERESRMMTVILVPEESGYKIHYTNPAVYKFAGKDALAIYEETLRMKKEGSLVAAYINSCMLGTVFRPGGYFRYEKDIEMEDLCYQLYLEITEAIELPLKLEGTSNSELGQIDFTNDETHGAIPRLLFKTDVPITDKAALEAEANKVIDALELLSPGLRKNFDYIRMDATNDELGADASTIKSDFVIIATK